MREIVAVICASVLLSSLAVPLRAQQDSCEVLSLCDSRGLACVNPISGGTCELLDNCEKCTQPSSLEILDDIFKSTRAEGGRWFLAEYDFDNRGYNVLHFQGHSPLPLGFSLWGFIDLEGADNTSSDREDISRHFLELDFKRKLWRNLGVVAELNDLQGQDNEIGRFGMFWAPDTNDWSPDSGLWAGKFRLGFKFFPVQTIKNTGQWSFNWNKQFDNICDGRFSAGGFFDLNYNSNNNTTAIVTEHQIRMRVAEGLHLITEFRVNQYLADDFGIAPGVQYRF